MLAMVSSLLSPLPSGNLLSTQDSRQCLYNQCLVNHSSTRLGPTFSASMDLPSWHQFSIKIQFSLRFLKIGHNVRGNVGYLVAMFTFSKKSRADRQDGDTHHIEASEILLQSLYFILFRVSFVYGCNPQPTIIFHHSIAGIYM